MTKEKKKILNYRINITLNKLKKFSKENNNSKKYESFNVISETGNSIYSPLFEELTRAVVADRGQIFISENAIRDIVRGEIRQRLIDRIKGQDMKSKVKIYQTIRDLETRALFKSGKSYQLDIHLRDKISDGRIEYTPFKNYFEIMKHTNELIRFLTGHQLTKGEFEYRKDHVNYSTRHRIDIVRSLDSRTIVALMEQFAMLRYAIESMESLVSGEIDEVVNQKLE